MKKPPPYTIAIDTREQRPYRFDNSEVVTLRTGDYSIVGLDDRVSIERKSKEDAYSSLGRGRKRFENELVRLSGLEYPAIVIESSLSEFLQQPPFSRMHPRSAVGSILSWSVKYRVHVFFACDRPHGNALTRQLLEKFWHYHCGARGDVKK